ncbi:MAG: hypothetical protein PV344_06340, partial [Anaplasma sp.]|nr:hypothetical protein [Anaplasma sp.]
SPLRVERDSVIGPRSHRLLIRFSCSCVTQRPSSHDTTLLVPKPCNRALRSLGSSVSGFRPMNYFIKLNHLRHAATFNSHYMSSFNQFHSTRDVTFHVSVVGYLKFPREVTWL